VGQEERAGQGQDLPISAVLLENQQRPRGEGRRDSTSCASPASQLKREGVSAGDFWPNRQDLSRYLNHMAHARIPEFESDMASHAVSLCGLCSRDRIWGCRTRPGLSDPGVTATLEAAIGIFEFGTGEVRFVSGSGVFVNDGGRQPLAWDCSIEPSITGRVFFSGRAFSDDCSPAREAAMAAFAKSWRRELKESPGCAGASRPTKGDTP
jgi:hypothetical protein